MPDREKVIKGLEICLQDNGCTKCPYYKKDNDYFCGVKNIMEDALALLKEQEKEIDEIADEYIDLGKEMAKQPKIVRCKDCKHGGCRTQRLDGSIFRVVCKKHGTKKNELWMDADWFCADGEQK